MVVYIILKVLFMFVLFCGVLLFVFCGGVFVLFNWLFWFDFVFYLLVVVGVIVVDVGDVVGFFWVVWLVLVVIGFVLFMFVEYWVYCLLLYVWFYYG